MILWDVRRV